MKNEKQHFHIQSHPKSYIFRMQFLLVPFKTIIKSITHIFFFPLNLFPLWVIKYQNFDNLIELENQLTKMITILIIIIFQWRIIDSIKFS